MWLKIKGMQRNEKKTRKARKEKYSDMWDTKFSFRGLQVWVFWDVTPRTLVDIHRFGRIFRVYFSTLKKEAACSSEMFVRQFIYQSTRRHIPGGNNLNISIVSFWLSSHLMFLRFSHYTPISLQTALTGWSLWCDVFRPTVRRELNFYISGEVHASTGQRTRKKKA
jgi:hypothetical protein